MVKPHASDIQLSQVRTSDIRMTYEYTRVTYVWHWSTYEQHTDDIRVAYEYMQVTYR